MLSNISDTGVLENRAQMRKNGPKNLLKASIS